VRARNPVGAEIDLIPVLSTIVHIIPIALIAVRFVTLHEHRLNSPPLVAEQAPSRELVEAQDEERVVVRILPEGFRVKGADAEESSIPCSGGCLPENYDYGALNSLMVAAHARHPGARQVVVAPDRNVPYETIIGVFDAVTETGPKGARRPLFAEPILVDGVDAPEAPVTTP
jgi:biopolymer transport protein ExbD